YVEELVGVRRDRREELVSVGEMGVGSTDCDAEASAGLGEGEVVHAPLCDELDGRLDQRRPEVAVVVAATLAFPRPRDGAPTRRPPGEAATSVFRRHSRASDGCKRRYETPVSCSDTSHSPRAATASRERALDSTRVG